jgi:hypothetical protein
MSGRRLVFLNHAADAGAPDDRTDYAVLDAAWTPHPGERPDLLPIRPSLWETLRDHNVHDESLTAMDDWARRADLVRRMDVGGVSWWFHARSFIRLDLQELILWRHVLDVIAPAGRYEQIVAPADRPHLLSALEAARTDGPGAATVVVGDAMTAARVFGGGKPSKAAASRRPWYRRVISRSIRYGRRAIDLRKRARARLLRERFGDLARRKPEVLAIVRGESFHLVRGVDGEERFDPIVTPVLRRLAQRGLTAAIVVLGTVPDSGSGQTSDNESAMPLNILADVLLERSEQDDDLERLTSRLAGIEAVPLPVASVDLAPAVVRVLASLDRWFYRQQREAMVAERLIEVLRPRALLTGWEAARTAWLAAARGGSVPSVAVQHGVIYHNNPDYYRPAAPGLIHADLTCVFGAFERGLLVDECGYAPDAVQATGSPRTTPAVVLPAPDPDERVDVRRALGIGDGERMLVISAARHAIGEGLHSVTICGRLLDGELPGIHVVVKLHPEEERGDHYAELIDGLARAGGYVPTPVTVVRDIDLFRLLRAADAHLGIYSTVLTDAVVAGTPNMIAVGQAWADLLGYVSAGVAQPVASVADVRAFMQDPRAPSADARAAFLREHYEPGDGAERIADAVIQLADRTRRHSTTERIEGTRLAASSPVRKVGS